MVCLECNIYYFWSSCDLHYAEVRHEQRFEYIPFISRVTFLTLENKSRINLGSTSEKFQNNVARVYTAW